jgi:hypothetical protein
LAQEITLFIQDYFEPKCAFTHISLLLALSAASHRSTTTKTKESRNSGICRRNRREQGNETDESNITASGKLQVAASHLRGKSAWGQPPSTVQQNERVCDIEKEKY